MRSAAWVLLVACTQAARPPAVITRPEPVVAPVGDATPVVDLSALYGTVAAPGTLFAGVELGAPVPATPPKWEGAEIELATDRVGLAAITVHLLECSDLAGALAKAWGPGAVWLDPATHRRARLDPAACKLRFDRYADVDAWLDRTTTAIVPLGIIGTPAKQLRVRLGARLEVDEPEMTSTGRSNPNSLLGTMLWTDVGVGAGDDPNTPRTVIKAFVSHGKIVGLNVRASVDPATGTAIRDWLTALLGASPKQNTRGVLMEWTGPPRVLLDLDGSRFEEKTAEDKFRIEVGTQRASGMH